MTTPTRRFTPPIVTTVDESGDTIYNTTNEEGSGEGDGLGYLSVTSDGRDSPTEDSYGMDPPVPTGQDDSLDSNTEGLLTDMKNFVSDEKC